MPSSDGAVSSRLRHHVSRVRGVRMCVEAAAACGGLLSIRTKDWRDTYAVCQSPVLCSVKSCMTLLQDIQGLVISVRLASAYFITSAFRLRLVKPGTFRPSTSPCMAVAIMKSSS